MSTRVNIEKKRMEFAFDKAKEASNPKKYDSYVQKIPAFIITNGLGNTLAYIASQSDSNWQKLGEHIFLWLNQAVFNNQLNGGQNKVLVLLEELKNTHDDNLIKLCTSETLALLNWLRRFSKIYR